MTQQSHIFAPLSQEFQRDRHAVLKEMRTHCPIYKENDETISGRSFTRWTFTTYEDVLMILRDKRFVREIHKVLPTEAIPPIPEAIRTLAESQQNTMLFRDPPDHTRLRALVNKAFTPRMVEQLEVRICEISRHLLKDIEPGSTFDLVRQFAFPLPVIVIAELLGVPVEERERFKEWSTIFARTIDYKPSMEILMRGNQMTIEFRDYFRDIVRKRSRQPQDDLVSELIRVSNDGDRLSEEELLDMCILILVAGHETTINLIANSVYLLTQYPEQQALLRRQPELLGTVIEEVQRFESPVQMTGRTVAEDFEYKGHILKRGDFVNGWIASANRDPEIFTVPDTFDITRENNRHLAFGQGIHYCLGAPLARKEGAVAIQTLLEKFSSLSRYGGQVEWVASPLMRSLKELIVQV